MRLIEKVSIPVDFDLSFLKIRWSDHIFVKDRGKVLGEGVVYGGDWGKAERLARQMAEMRFEKERGDLRVCEQLFITNQKSDIRNQILEIVKRGSNLKLKVGRNVFEDIKVIEFIMKGSDLLKRSDPFTPSVRIDANQGYSLKQLRYIIPTLKEFGIKYVEEPVKVKNLPAAAELLHRYGLKIILDESLMLSRGRVKLGRGDLRDCHVVPLRGTPRNDEESIDVINIKLSRIGDINQALHLIKVAKKYKKQVVIGCSEELERGMRAIYALGHVAKKSGVLLEVEGFGPLRLRNRNVSIPRWLNRAENLFIIAFHRISQYIFDYVTHC